MKYLWASSWSDKKYKSSKQPNTIPDHIETLNRRCAKWGFFPCGTSCEKDNSSNVVDDLPVAVIADGKNVSPVDTVVRANILGSGFQSIAFNTTSSIWVFLLILHRPREGGSDEKILRFRTFLIGNLSRYIRTVSHNGVFSQNGSKNLSQFLLFWVFFEEKLIVRIVNYVTK